MNSKKKILVIVLGIVFLIGALLFVYFHNNTKNLSDEYTKLDKDNVFVYYSAIGILKVQRIIFNAIDKVCKFKLHKIYCAHGCFVIFSKQAIFDLVPIYDEKMFLFYEEEYLARRAYLKKLPIYYTSDIQIKHKEDGSMKIANINQRKEAHKSIIYYYENRMKFL